MHTLPSQAFSTSHPSFSPVERPRRWRRSDPIRAMLSETLLLPRHLIYPLFIAPHLEAPSAVASMPGVYQLPLHALEAEVSAKMAEGIRTFLLFGVVDASLKDDLGTHAHAHEAGVQQALRQLKSTFGESITLWADTCLCGYTRHGHCGPLCETTRTVDNDAALYQLAQVAVAQAEAGADFIAPSDMMDGRVKAIRHALDHAGYPHVGIISYSVKHASAFYGPFRDAACSAPSFGDRKTYQMDSANRVEAQRELMLDVEEGADGLIIKPGISCLDLIHLAHETTSLPVFAYSVSGEYSMVEAAAEKGWLDGVAVHWEMAIALRRAGATGIITYAASALARQAQRLYGV
ncbi:MAG: porphobilinogen synthase [Vampirovibrionales bacterium]